MVNKECLVSIVVVVVAIIIIIIVVVVSPELIEGRVYNEKADIWAAGCILYQMAELLPPFQSTNLLALAKKVSS